MAINLLDLTPHKVSRDLSGYITYIYGEAKIGKTSLAAQAEDCLLLAAERGYNAIDGIFAVDITCWKDMRDVYKQLKTPEVKARYKVLIVDTIDLVAKYCTKYICNQHGVAELGDLAYGKGYSLMRSEFEDIFNSLTQMGYAIIFISHVKRSIDEDTGRVTVGPSLSPDKVNDIIRNMADIYGWAHYANDAEQTGQRVLTLRSNSDNISCGTRFPYMKNEIPFSYDSLIQALKEAIDEAEQNGNSENFTDEPIAPIHHEANFDELMTTFKDLVSKIQTASGDRFKTDWAPRITEITDRYLGKGKKVNDMSRNQVEMLDLIVSDLMDAVANGI